jgi:Uma2 family endonuclease
MRPSSSVDRISTEEYLSSPETTARQSLIYGVLVREPAAPLYGHQAVVTQLTVLIDDVARRGAKGLVCVSPIDVVLDADRALVLQPDVLFVSAARRSIVTDRIHGAPDLVVEVLSTRTERRDRLVKVRLYKKYGVHECWLVDTGRRSIECLTLRGRTRRRSFRGRDVIQSATLGTLPFTASAVFDTR